jgi:arylsulfatase A-like enzyme
MFRLVLVCIQASMQKWTLLAIALGLVTLFSLKIFYSFSPPKIFYLTAISFIAIFLAITMYLFFDNKINRPKGPNIIIVVSDALRKDHLGCYGYKKNTSPNIDLFAEEATLFSYAFAQSPSTKPSITSLFTSLYPCQHNVIDNENILPLSLLTLAEVLSQSRYITAGFTENLRISGKFKFSQGFNTWVFKNARKKELKERNYIDEHILAWLEKNHKKPFFLYIHFLDPHAPYLPPPPYSNMFDPDYKGNSGGTNSKLEHLMALYDGEIRFIDSRFSLIIKKIKELGILENSVLFFTSDHGEEFRERGNLHHSSSVNGEQINIPLLIRYPELFKKMSEKKLVQHIDIFPTVLDILHIKHPSIPLEGSSILARNNRSITQKKGQKTIISEHSRKDKGLGLQKCIIRGEWKLIHNIRLDSFILFNIYEDPAETTDLAEEKPEAARQLKALLLSWEQRLKGIVDPKSIRLEKKTKEELKSLGYIH